LSQLYQRAREARIGEEGDGYNTPPNIAEFREELVAVKVEKSSALQELNDICWFAKGMSMLITGTCWLYD